MALGTNMRGTMTRAGALTGEIRGWSNGSSSPFASAVKNVNLPEIPRNIW